MHPHLVGFILRNMHFVALFILMLQPADPSIYRSHDFLSVRRLHCDVPVTRIILSNSNMHLSLVCFSHPDDDCKRIPFHRVFACFENWVQSRERLLLPRRRCSCLHVASLHLHLIASPSTWDPHKRCNKRNAAVLYSTDILQVLNRGWGLSSG